MQSPRPKARASKLIPLLMMSAAALSACVSAPPVFQIANTCSELIPEDWIQHGIESAPLPPDRTAGAWIGFGLAQTGQLDKANSQTHDAVQIVRKCEARDRAAFQALQPKPWWKIW